MFSISKITELSLIITGLPNLRCSGFLPDSLNTTFYRHYDLETLRTKTGGQQIIYDENSFCVEIKAEHPLLQRITDGFNR